MLLATKFLRPAPDSRCIHRERLFDRLQPRTSKRLTVIVAPAGYGKTTLLAQWGTRQTEPVAWLSLDEADDDLRRFWQYLVGALERLSLIKGGKEIRAQIDNLPEQQIDQSVTALLNALAEANISGTLVVDDYHLIQRVEIHKQLAYLVDYLPPGLRLLIVSRTEPPLPLARWRVRGWLDELHAADLAFSVSESHRFFTDYMGIDLSEDQARTLWRRTEGWAAAMQLAALSGQHAEPGDIEALMEYSGDSKFISEYVLSEILEQQSPDLHQFLLETACILRLSAALCDFMRDTKDSQALLERLVQANLFIIPLDVRGEWYRYHDLFREALSNRLRQTDPRRFQQLQENAVHWLLSQQQIQEAAAQLIQLKDWNWLAEVLHQHGNTLIHAGQHPQVLRWLDRLPPALVDQSPRLQMLRIWALFFSNKHDALEPLLGHVEDLLDQRVAESHPDAQNAVVLHSEIALIRSYLARARSDLQSAGELMAQVLKDIDHTNIPLKSVTYYGIGLDGYASGDLVAARTALHSAIDYGKLEKKHATVMSSSGLLAWILFHQGELDTALSLCMDIRQWVESFQSDPSQPRLLSCWQNAALIEIYREKDELALAQAYLAPLLQHLEQGTEPGQHIIIQYMKAHLAFSRKNYTEAMLYLEDAESVLQQKRDAIVFEPPGVDALKARCWLASGRLDLALEWESEQAEASCRNPLNREQNIITSARILVANGQPKEAIQRLNPLRLETENAQHTKHLIELLCVYASALAGQQRKGDALRMLERAVHLAAKHGFIRVFTEEGPHILDLLKQIDSYRVSESYWQKLLPFLQEESTPDAAVAKPDQDGLLEPLSSREREVLTLINAGLANKDIACKLDVAPATIKAHIRNLYGKLDAHSRTSALLKARQLGLLP